jgi:hypothetical protein
MKHFTSFQLQFAFILLLLLPVAVSAQNKPNRDSKPAPYPVLKSTGNSSQDKQAYENAVKEWNENELKRNQELKKVQNAPLSGNAKDDVTISKNLERKESLSKVNEMELSSTSNIRQTTIIDLPGYPKYVSSGNEELDEKNYQQNKAKWINDNPAAYENYLKELRKQNPSTLKRIDHSNSSK